VDAIPGKTDKLILNTAQRMEVLKKVESIANDRQITKRIEIMGAPRIISRLRNPFSDEGHYDKGIIDTLPCYVGWTFSRILANGDVNACLKAHRIPVGNIYNESFQYIWNSPQQKLFRIKTGNVNKDDTFFRLIGNDPNVKIGCHRGCDDLERTLTMIRRLEILTNFEKKMLKKFARKLELYREDRLL
jgi:hypothetical protein